MSFTGILILVLVAAILLVILFTFFHILIPLIPIAIIVAVVIWLINRFSGKSKDNVPSSNNDFSWFDNQNETHSGRKKARNVTTKDVDDNK